MAVLVIGATGKTGRPLVAALAGRGVDVRAASRTPDGPGTTRFDWADRGSWAPALRGADGLYLVGPVGQAGGDGLVPELLAAAGDVRRVVLLSVLGADRLPGDVPMAAWERDVRASGKDWTVVRPNWFQQNFGTGFRAGLRDTGELALPAGDAAVSFVDTRDIADVAAAALTGDGHAGRVYELTGPEAFTHPQALAVLGAAAGRELRYVPLDPTGHADRMRAAGVPERAVRMQAALFALMRDGGDAAVDGTVERVTGHPARSLAAYARENAGGWQK